MVLGGRSRRGELLAAQRGPTLPEVVGLLTAGRKAPRRRGAHRHRILAAAVAGFPKGMTWGSAPVYKQRAVAPVSSVAGKNALLVDPWSALLPGWARRDGLCWRWVHESDESIATTGSRRRAAGVTPPSRRPRSPGKCTRRNVRGDGSPPAQDGPTGLPWDGLPARVFEDATWLCSQGADRATSSTYWFRELGSTVEGRLARAIVV